MAGRVNIFCRVLTFRVQADAPADQIRELCVLAQRHSPVFDIVSNPTPVTVHVEEIPKTGRAA